VGEEVLSSGGSDRVGGVGVEKVTKARTSKAVVVEEEEEEEEVGEEVVSSGGSGVSARA